VDINETWAYRESARNLVLPILPVRVLQFGPPRSAKVRVRMLGGEYEGLDFWVPKQRLLVKWDEVDAWKRDEELFEEVRKASEGMRDTPEYNAALLVLEAYPRSSALSLGWNRHEAATLRVWALGDVCRDLGLEEASIRNEQFSFVDRSGCYVAPWLVAERIARRIAEVYSDLVLGTVDREERHMQEEAIYGHSYSVGRGANRTEYEIPPERCVEYLLERKPIFALVRQWCGQAAGARFDEVGELRAELQRLRGLVEDAARRFEESGHPRIARRLRDSLIAPRDSH
jgi:hypothetical protein